MFYQSLYKHRLIYPYAQIKTVVFLIPIDKANNPNILLVLVNTMSIYQQIHLFSNYLELFLADQDLTQLNVQRLQHQQCLKKSMPSFHRLSHRHQLLVYLCKIASQHGKKSPLEFSQQRYSSPKYSSRASSPLQTLILFFLAKEANIQVT